MLTAYSILIDMVGCYCADGCAMLLVCPGIANSSENAYIRAFVHHAQQHGFRVAVLNHLGSVRDVPLTSPRLYTYGELQLQIISDLYTSAV